LRFKRFMVMFMFMLLLGICFSHVSYADEGYENLPAKVGVDVTKTWSIKFNAELMPSTVNSQNIMVLDENNTSIPVVVMLQGDNKTVVVSPPGKYIAGKTYTLVVTKNVKSAVSGNLNNAIKMKFTTKTDGSSPGTYTVVIDAGHGGSDSTSIVGSSGIKEKDVDLAVALKVGTILKSSGVNVIYTRTDDTYLDYASRVKISNTASADYFLSIHCNTASATATGTDIIYSDQDSKSLSLATAVQANMYQFTGLKERNLIANSSIPEMENNNASTIKVCLGFLSNPEEEKKLASDDFQNKCAQSIASALLQCKGVASDNGIVSAKNVVMNITEGQSYTLPSTVQVQYKDSTTKQLPVIWNAAGVNNQAAGTYTCTGITNGYSKPIYATLIVMSKNSGNKPTVTIDAGHGGNDPGAIGYQGLKEADVTLQVALKTGKILEEKGINVVYTRKDNNVSWPTGGDGDVVKDLQTRCDISNAANANYFVAIHCNAADSSAKGTETYYYANNVAGQVLAQNVQDSLVGSIKSVDRGIKTANWYVIVSDHINAPSILTEIGFVTNPDEAALLESDSYEQLVAQGIANGVLKSLGKQ
jgi:N-acetylmuramoyl-L-alanine amidase